MYWNRIVNRTAAVCILIAIMVVIGGCTGTATLTTTPAISPTIASPATQGALLGYSPKSPAIIGATLEDNILFAIGYMHNEMYNVKITLLEVVRGEKAWGRIKAAGASNKPPDTGFEYILAHVKFEFLATDLPGNLSHTLKGEQFVAYSANGKQYGATSVIPPKPELSGTLYSGDSAEGWVVLQVPQDDSKPLMTFCVNPGGAFEQSGHMWFQLY
jgi:hypothetical protein